MIKSKIFTNKIINSILVSSLLVLYIFYFVPSGIYISNPNEFSYLLGEIIPYLLILSIALILIISSSLVLIKEKFFKIVLSVLISLFLLFWLEGNLFYRDYGPLDGRLIIWDKWKIWGYINALIWLFIISISIYLRNYIYRYIKYISIILILSFTVNFIVEYKKLEYGQKGELIFDDSVIANFSKNKNIIVLLLDEIQSDIFYEIIQENSYYRDIFDGFIYYPDTVSGFPWTVPSVSLMLTGEYYDNSELFSEYIQRVYLDNSFLTYLIDSNFRVELFPKFYDFNYYKSEEVASNIIRTGDIVSTSQGTIYSIQLIDLSLFRVAPHLLRRYIYNNNKFTPEKKSRLRHIDWLYYDKEFVQRIDSNSKLIYKEPAFKFFHLRGAHAPWFTDYKGNFLRGDGSRKNYKDHVIYKLKLIKQLFNKFKQLGIYNNSIIYIISDHGAGRSIKTKLKTDITKIGAPNTANLNIPYQVKARAVNLFLKKPENSNGNLDISDRAFCNSEFPSEILSDLGIKPDKLSKYDRSVKDTVSRRYFYYSYLDTRKYLPPLYEFIIKGNSWLDTSWYGPINIYTKDGVYQKLWGFNFNNGLEDYIESKNNSLDGTELSSISDREFHFDFKNRNYDDLLLNIALNYKEEIKEREIEIYMNENKLINVKTKDNYSIINHPYQAILIKKDYVNNNNVIKLRFQEPPDSSSANIISSIGLYEFVRKQY